MKNILITCITILLLIACKSGQENDEKAILTQNTIDSNQKITLITSYEIQKDHTATKIENLKKKIIDSKKMQEKEIKEQLVILTNKQKIFENKITLLKSLTWEECSNLKNGIDSIIMSLNKEIEEIGKKEILKMK